MLNNAGIMHVSYVLILYSVAFVVFLCMFPFTPRARRISH